MINNRTGSALYLTVFSIIVLAEFAAPYGLKAESHNPNANITIGGDAVWWVFVTITTVGYGDKFTTVARARFSASSRATQSASASLKSAGQP